jgi:hypothetical protein
MLHGGHLNLPAQYQQQLTASLKPAKRSSSPAGRCHPDCLIGCFADAPGQFRQVLGLKRDSVRRNNRPHDKFAADSIQDAEAP